MWRAVRTIVPADFHDSCGASKRSAAKHSIKTAVSYITNKQKLRIRVWWKQDSAPFTIYSYIHILHYWIRLVLLRPGQSKKPVFNCAVLLNATNQRHWRLLVQKPIVAISWLSLVGRFDLVSRYHDLPENCVVSRFASLWRPPATRNTGLERQNARTCSIN